MRDEEEAHDMDDDMDDEEGEDTSSPSSEAPSKGSEGGKYGARESKSGADTSVMDTSQASLGAPLETPSSPPDKSAPIGYEEARKMIMERHGVVIDKEDPLLIMVTLLDEHRAKIHKEHERAIAKLRGVVELAKTELVGAAEETSRVILDQAVNSNLRNTLAKLASETQLIETLRFDIRKHRMWVGIFTGVIVGMVTMLLIIVFNQGA